MHPSRNNSLFIVSSNAKETCFCLTVPHSLHVRGARSAIFTGFPKIFDLQYLNPNNIHARRKERLPWGLLFGRHGGHSKIGILLAAGRAPAPPTVHFLQRRRGDDITITLVCLGLSLRRISTTNCSRDDEEHVVVRIST